MWPKAKLVVLLLLLPSVDPARALCVSLAIAQRTETEIEANTPLVFVRVHSLRNSYIIQRLFVCVCNCESVCVQATYANLSTTLDWLEIGRAHV